MIARFKFLRPYRAVAIFFAHVAIVVLSFSTAVFLRFELSIPADMRVVLLQTLPPLLVIRLVLFHRYHLFSGWWQYVGTSDVVEIFKSVTVGTLVLIPIVFLTNLYPGFPRSIFILEWLLTVQFLAGARVLSRMLHSVLQRIGIEEERTVLIVASRAMAESLLRELTVHPSQFRPIGFVIVGGDQTARRIQGVPVLGGVADLERILARGIVTEVFVALPAEEREAIQQTLGACRQARVGFRTISSVRDVLDRPRVGEGVNLEELFEVESPHVDASHWPPLFEQKVVLLLGAAGLLGSDLASRIASARPRQLLLFDRNESALYYLEVDFLRRLAMVPLTPLIGDVLDDQRLRQVLQTYRPDLVIHAAAYAGDTLGATNAEEIRRNNLLGVQRVLRAAADFGVERLLLLSTDEVRSDGLACVHRATEYLLRSQQRASSSVYAAVRFPSVVGSPACEVTKIARSLERGLPVIVASSDARVRVITRRTVSPLVLEAFAIAADGDVLAIDAGENQTCEEVARYLRRVWNIPDAPIEASTVLPEHIHPLEVGTATSHPSVLRRELAPHPPPCVAALLHGLDFEPEIERFAQLS